MPLLTRHFSKIVIPVKAGIHRVIKQNTITQLQYPKNKHGMTIDNKIHDFSLLSYMFP